MPETTTEATAGAARVLPGCGHLLELDCPGQTDRYLTSFLAPG